MRWLIGSLLVIITLSTACNRRLQQSTQTYDSTSVKETIRWQVVEVPGDSIPFEVRIECDSVTNKPLPIRYKQGSKRAAVNLKLDTLGVLTGISYCDSLQLQVEIKDREISRLKSEKTVVEVPVQYTAWYDLVARYLALLFIVVMVFTIRDLCKNRISNL
jgi:hypothetical protein